MPDAIHYISCLKMKKTICLHSKQILLNLAFSPKKGGQRAGHFQVHKDPKFCMGPNMI